MNLANPQPDPVRLKRGGGIANTMDKLKLFKLAGQNLARVFNSRCGHACACNLITLITKTAELKVENLAQTTSRLSRVSFRAPPMNVPQMSIVVCGRTTTICKL
jgi:hypothetical protein